MKQCRMEQFAAVELEPDDGHGSLDDPCDGCGDDAFLTVTFPHGVLVFCRSCWRRHENAIREEAVAIRG